MTSKMKRFYRVMMFGLAAGVWFSSTLVSPATAGELVVVDGGESRYVIAVAAEAESRRIGEAAEFLQQTVERATGVKLPIVPEADVAPGVPAIYLGWSNAARQAGIDVEGITGWSYLNRVVGEDIFLVGEDRETFIAPGPRRLPLGPYGSFKAVTAFLEDQAGVKYLLPGEYGLHIPESDRLAVDADMDTAWSPLFDFHTGRASSFFYRTDGIHSKAFGFANHLFGASEFVFDYGGHSYYYSVPVDEYWESNPEYFALIGGVRTREGNHLCISNPEVQEIMLQEMERQFDRGFELVELEQTDGYIPCECDECRAIHPEPGERTWIVHRDLAEEISRRRPGKKVKIASYPPTHRPPASFESFPDNVVIRLTRYRPEDFENWRKSGFDVPMTLYTTNWLTTHPRMSAWVAVQQVRLFLDNNVRGIYLCGGLHPDRGGNWYPWGLGGPGYYAYFKALHDPGVDPAAMRAEYVNAAFGEAAAPMQAFFETLDERMDHFWKLYRRDSWNGPPVRMMRRGTGDFQTHFYPPGNLRDMSRSLDRAREMARDEKVRARLKLVDLEFTYLRSLAAVYHLYRVYLLSPGWATLEMLEEQVKKFEETLDILWPGGERVEIPGGLPSPFAGSFRRGAGGPPFNWDFALLRETGVLPGVGMKRATAPLVDPIELDGRLDKPAWEEIPFEEIGEIGMGRAPSETYFKAARDDENLYLGFRGGLTSPTVLDGVTSVGRDGVAWRQENMEIVLDPHGTRRMYYHFILNPVPDSSLERRFGYYEDPDHPLFQDFEWDWRGEWEYAAHIDREDLSWSAEVRIPFETLGVDPPRPGDVWTLNVGRTQYLEDERKVDYLWSPNIESRTFHDRETFGELHFE